uniref:Uncharacterized protein n=1 Tax=Anopheles atroparvus TaxID=41427 RepID=A0AAG5DPT5_ANOAO
MGSDSSIGGAWCVGQDLSTVDRSGLGQDALTVHRFGDQSLCWIDWLSVRVLRVDRLRYEGLAKGRLSNDGLAVARLSNDGLAIARLSNDGFGVGWLTEECLGVRSIRKGLRGVFEVFHKSWSLVQGMGSTVGHRKSLRERQRLADHNRRGGRSISVVKLGLLNNRLAQNWSNVRVAQGRSVRKVGVISLDVPSAGTGQRRHEQDK